MGDTVLCTVLNNTLNTFVKLIMEATKARHLSRMECYTLCDLIMINANGPLVQYWLTLRFVDKKITVRQKRQIAQYEPESLLPK